MTSRTVALTLDGPRSLWSFSGIFFKFLCQCGTSVLQMNFHRFFSLARIARRDRGINSPMLVHALRQAAGLLSRTETVDSQKRIEIFAKRRYQSLIFTALGNAVMKI